MTISEHIPIALINKFNGSLPENVYKNHSKACIGTGLQYLTNTRLTPNDGAAGFLFKVNNLAAIMQAPTSLLTAERSSTKEVETEPQVIQRCEDITQALNTFVKEGKDALLNLLNSLAEIASKIQREVPALT